MCRRRGSSSTTTTTAVISSSTTTSETAAESIAGAIVRLQAAGQPAARVGELWRRANRPPFFQFIEALYASGITGGCGAGNYCPDNPVTRGQMAVFLAKALGPLLPVAAVRSRLRREVSRPRLTT
jgi:hypothetical protein